MIRKALEEDSMDESVLLETDTETTFDEVLELTVEVNSSEDKEEETGQATFEIIPDGPLSYTATDSAPLALAAQEFILQLPVAKSYMTETHVLIISH
jgi:hypothetical protein